MIPLMQETDRPRNPNKRRGIFRSVALTGSAVGLGAALLYSTGEPTPVPERRASVTSTTIFEARINLSSLPSVLPKAVEEKVGSVLDVGVKIPGTDPLSAASGVKIVGAHGEENIVLTAGHLLVQSADRPSKEFTCRDLVLAGRGDGNDFMVGIDYVKRAQASFNDDDTVPDLTILKMGQSESFSQLPSSEISDSAPSIGDSVFFVNYEPTSDKIERDPTSANSNGLDSPETLPAEYPGEVVGISPTGAYVVLTGLRSYGLGYPDTTTRPGASGGPVYNSEGKIIGLVTRVSTNPVEKEYLEALYRVHLNDASDKTNLSISYVQPVTPNLIASFEQALNGQTDNCTPAPKVLVPS